jgi:predicted nucleotidyltransferase
VGIDESVIQQIVERILSVMQPDKIILFGSAVADQMTRDSDIDLLIVEPDTSDQRNEYVRIVKALWDIDYPFDILFINTPWFEQSKDVIGGIAHPAHKYGKVIYDAAA